MKTKATNKNKDNFIHYDTSGVEDIVQKYYRLFEEFQDCYWDEDIPEYVEFEFAEKYAAIDIFGEMSGFNEQVFEAYHKKFGKCLGLEIEYDFTRQEQGLEFESYLVEAAKEAELLIILKPDSSLCNHIGIEINTAPASKEQLEYFLTGLLSEWSPPSSTVHDETGMHLNIDRSWFVDNKSELFFNWMSNHEGISGNLTSYFGREFNFYSKSSTFSYSQLLSFSSLTEALEVSEKEIDWRKYTPGSVYYSLKCSVCMLKESRWEWRSFKAPSSIDNVFNMFDLLEAYLDICNNKQDLFVEQEASTVQNICKELERAYKLCLE